MVGGWGGGGGGGGGSGMEQNVFIRISHLIELMVVVTGHHTCTDLASSPGPVFYKLRGGENRAWYTLAGS